MKFLNSKIKDYINDNAKFVLECDDMDTYDFPTEDEIPERCYASMIMGIRPYRDKFKNDYFDVCYKIFPTYLISWWENDQIKKISYFYIRQRYLCGSDEARRFRAVMRKASNCNVLTEATLIGITETFTLRYDKDGNASIKNRSCSELEPEWFIDDISNKFHV